MLGLRRTLEILQKQPNSRTFKAGQVVFKAGQPSDVTYGIVEGEVHLVIDDRAVETIGPGKVFGVAALIEEQPRSSYTAIVKTDCQLAVIDEEWFAIAIRKLPMFVLEVMQSYSERLKRLERIRELSGSSR